MQEHKPFLEPNLSISQLAQGMKLSTPDLSHIINNGFSVNFSDYINQYRVDAFNQRLVAGDHEQFSFLAIALECGFNSKATFNRVYKKLMGVSPSEYVRNLSK